MRYIYAVLFLLFVHTVHAQDQTSAQLRETAKTLMMQGDLDNAIKTLEHAKQIAPTDIDVLKELAYAAYIKKDYARSMEVGKEAVANPLADAQAYQILGLAYKAIALYKDADKLYKAGIAKFPNDGVLFNEYGELLGLDNKIDEAIAMWERGIRADPNYNNNYYNAALFYSRSQNWLKLVIYGEIFVNLESYTPRTETMKKILYGTWVNLFQPRYFRFMLNTKTISDFERSIYTLLDKSSMEENGGINTDILTSIRSKFIVDWAQENDKIYPFQLFKHEQNLLTLGYFEAYNQWLFGEAANADAYKLWQTNHEKQAAAFKTFQQGRVFKIPPGQYYFSK